MKEKIKKIDLIVIALVIIVAITYISLIFNDSVWEDEAYTMLILKKNFGGILESVSVDVHPPLYYIIAKMFTIILENSVPIVKLASIIPVILVILFVNKKSKILLKENTKLITILFALLIGFSPRAFSMNIELRMYTWAMFFVTCSGIYAYEVYKDSNKFNTTVHFIICSLCAAYTHYYAAVTECFIYLCLMISLLKKDRSNWTKCLKIIIFTIVGYLPWIPVFIKQFFVVKDNWWLQTFTIDNIIYFVKYLFDGRFVFLFLTLILGIIIGLIVHLSKNKEDDEATFALLSIFSFVMTIMLGILISIIIRPLFLDRYMYPACGLFFLGISIAVSKNKYKNILKVLLIGLIILNIPFSYSKKYVNEYKTGTEEFKEFIKNNISSADIISTDSYELYWSMLPYYLNENKIEFNYINDDFEKYIFTKRDIEQVKKIIPEANINLVFNGNIDNIYEFNVYYIKPI